MTKTKKKEIKELKGRDFTDKFIEEFAEQWDEVVFILRNRRKSK